MWLFNLSGRLAWDARRISVFSGGMKQPEFAGYWATRSDSMKRSNREISSVLAARFVLACVAGRRKGGEGKSKWARRKKVPRSSHDLLGLHALAFPISLPEWCCRRFCMCASPPKQDPMARAQTRGLIGRSFFWLSSVTTGICKEEREGLRTNPTSLTCCFTWKTWSARPRDPCKIGPISSAGPLSNENQSPSQDHDTFGQHHKSGPLGK